MCEEEEIIKKVYTENNSRSFRLKVIWKGNSFQLTVIEEANAWCANVNLEDINEYANLHGINLQKYCNNLKQYIFDMPQDISFNIDENNLIIYRTVNKMRIKYFSATLMKVDYLQCVENIIDDLAIKNLDLTKKLKTVISEKDKCVSDKECYENKLKEFVDVKSKHETQLLSNFLIILNEKKKRIQHLNEILEVYKCKKSLQKQNTDIPVIKRKNSKKKVSNDSESSTKNNVEEVHSKIFETISPSESDTDGSDTTDNELVNIKSTETEPLPSTSKESDDNDSFLNEDPLPTSILPKRSKNTDNISSGTLQVILQKDENNSLSVNDEENMQLEEDSPVLDFDTQNLLDRM